MGNRTPYFLLFLLVAATVIAYANSLNVDFVYDDYAFVRNNEEIRTFTPLGKFLLSAETFSQPANYHVYRPLATATFAVNYALGYHIVNLAFHALNAFLVMMLLRLLGFQPGPSFAGALVFAIHPVHTEAVTWISGRGNVLYVFFFLLAYLCYIRADSAPGPRRFTFLAGAVAAYVLAVLAKEMALTLPAVLFGHDLYFHREWDAKQRLRRLWVYVPFAVVAAGYVLLRTHVLGRIGQVAYYGGSAYVTFLAMLKAFVIYARLLFAPVGLSLSRHFQPSHSILEPPVLLCLCLVILTAIAGILAMRRSPYLSFGLYWFAVTMLPVSNIIPINAIVGDRFLYGPSIGFCILVAVWAAGSLKLEGGRRRLAHAALMAVILCFMLLSIGRNNDWRNTFLLWSKTVQNSPTSFVAYNNLALEYMKRGRIPEAIEALEKAVELKEDLTEARLNLALCYSASGRIDDAIRHYEEALIHLEKRAEVRCKLASLLERRGRANDAIEQYEAAVNENPGLLEAHRRLAALYGIRDVRRAIEHCRVVLKLAPEDSDAYDQLARLHYEQGDAFRAAEVLRKGLAIDPGNDSLRQFLQKIEQQSEVGPNF
jgi:tetratricopeptide (TPR) repeat protein